MPLLTVTAVLHAGEPPPVVATPHYRYRPARKPRWLVKVLPCRIWFAIVRVIHRFLPPGWTGRCLVDVAVGLRRAGAGYDCLALYPRATLVLPLLYRAPFALLPPRQLLLCCRDYITGIPLFFVSCRNGWTGLDYRHRRTFLLLAVLRRLRIYPRCRCPATFHHSGPDYPVTGWCWLNFHVPFALPLHAGRLILPQHRFAFGDWV